MYYQRYRKKHSVADRLLSLSFNFLPANLVQQIIVHRLSSFGSYEEREMAYGEITCWYWLEPRYYNESIDYAIQAFKGTVKLENTQYRAVKLHFQDKRVLESIANLGIKDANDVSLIIKKWQDTHYGIPLDLLPILVENKIIGSENDIDDLDDRRFCRSLYPFSIDGEDEKNLVENMCTLKDYGVPIEDIRRSLSQDFFRCGADRLVHVLGAIENCGIKIDPGYADLCDIVFHANIVAIEFLFRELNVNTAPGLMRYRDLLEAHDDNFNGNVIKSLRDIGVSDDDIPRYQRMIHTDVACYHENDAIAGRIVALSRPPFSLSKDEILKCEDYVIDKRLPFFEFINIFKAHSVTDYGYLCALHPFLRHISTTNLAAIFDVLKSIVALDQYKQDVINFVEKFVSLKGNIHNLAYLKNRFSISDIETFSSLIKISTVTDKVLQYALEKHGIGTARELSDWYYHDAVGVNSVGSLYTLDHIGDILLDDAFKRKRFFLLTRNNNTLGEAVYRNGMGKDKLNPDTVILMLNLTNGVIFPSLVSHLFCDDLDALRSSIERLDVIVEDLKTGDGPANNDLTDDEVYGISLVFNISEGEIRRDWSVISAIKDNTISPVSGGSHYRIDTRWVLETYKMVENVRLDDEGFRAIAKALDRVNEKSSEGVSAEDGLLDGFRYKHLKNNSATPMAIWPYLVLFIFFIPDFADRIKIIASEFSTHDLSDHGRYKLLRMCEEAFSHWLLQVVQDFKNNLLDEINCNAAVLQSVLRSFRMDISASGVSRVDRDNMGDVLDTVLRKSQQVFLDWVGREKRKYSKLNATSGNNDYPLYCVYTKTPAAFFAKRSAGLCSAGKTNLWTCASHAHLLVFDQRSPFLVGMVSIYIEEIPEVCQGKTLIVRNLSIIDKKSGYHADSVVKSYISVAQELALQLGCVAAAFPDQAGQDYCTNDDDLWGAVKKRYRLGEDRRSMTRVRFSPYKENENEDILVFVFWRKPTA
ncbi:hypothetical protein B1757_13660 [Acidithiobacillus marinus]|uniref:Uncharacterized protein n=1 Tax=Acidithiobacillus marinus TaxID=187490 RepID=A0A2I1DIF1_9PROT|nr:hypothetical protein [Acidithiobacillus marinus]PKY09645.1 hypothetical protein B1757_13660 [Acidithiobacillus marinus]